MTSEFKAAIFDMDGTLLESMKYWRMAGLEYIIGHDLPYNDEILSGIFRRGAGMSVKMAYELAGNENYKNDWPRISDKILEYVIPHYARDVKLKPNVIEYLEKLKKEGIRCCVATATQKEYAIEALKKQGIDKYFEFVFDTDDAGCSKANEQFFAKVVEKLGCDKAECAMFEDALYSIRTAKAYGMKVVGIQDACAEPDAEEIKALSDIYITDYCELL